MGYRQSVPVDQSFDLAYRGATLHIESQYHLTQADAVSEPKIALSLSISRSAGGTSWIYETWRVYLYRNETQVGETTFTAGSGYGWTSTSHYVRFDVDSGSLSDASYHCVVSNYDRTFSFTIDPVSFDAPVYPSITFAPGLSTSLNQEITIEIECDQRYTYSLNTLVYAPQAYLARRHQDSIAENASGAATYCFTPDPDEYAIGLRGKGHGSSSVSDHVAVYTYTFKCSVNGEERISDSYQAKLTYPAFGNVSMPEEITAGIANTVTLTNPNGYGYALILTADEDSVTAPALTETGSWTPAASAFAPLMTDCMSKTFSCKVQTYYHSVSCGASFALADVTVKLREIDVCPQPTAVIEDDAELRATYGDYVLLQSRLHITASAGLRYGATLETLKISANGTYYTGAEAITDVLESLDYDTVAIEATDSRGVTAVTEYTIGIVEWYTPRVTALAVHRCTSAGVRSDNGDHVLIEWGVSFAPVNDHNTRALTVQHPEGSSVVALSAYQQTGQMIVAADTEHSYNISLTLQDAFATFTRAVRLSTAGVILDILSGGKGVAFGKVAEMAAALEVNPDWTLICQTLKLAGVDLATRLADIEQRLTRGGL